MKKTFLSFLAFATVLITSSCAMLNPLAPTPVCISAQPTQADIDRALLFTSETFNTPDWERSYTVSENRVSVSWLNNSQGALAYLEALIFPCGYEEPDIDKYFNDENWKIIFQSYESYTSTSPMCRTDNGLRLYEFKAVSQGFDYDIRYWAKNDTVNRVITFMFVVPVGSESMMNDIASRLFPRLSTCSR